MRVPKRGASRDQAAEGLGWIAKLLHDLSQPLCALECRLYLTAMDMTDSREETRMAMGECQAELKRALDIVREMQEQAAQGAL